MRFDRFKEYGGESTRLHMFPTRMHLMRMHKIQITLPCSILLGAYHTWMMASREPQHFQTPNSRCSCSLLYVYVCIMSLLVFSSPCLCLQCNFRSCWLRSQTVNCITRLCSSILQTVLSLQVFILHFILKHCSSRFHNLTHLRVHRRNSSEEKKLM